MLTAVKLEWHYFLLALEFFTRIPVPHYAYFQESDLNYSAKYFPLIGIIIGLIGAGVFVVSAKFLPKQIAVLLSMASTIYVTGAFHEDGLADSADGLGGGYQREQILTIMQDSRLGTYGAVALFLMLLTKFYALNSLSGYFVPVALIAGHALSRLCAVWVMATLSYAKPKGKAKPLATKISLGALCLANVFGCLPFLGIITLFMFSQRSVQLVNFIPMTIIPTFFAWLWWRQKMKYWLGGYTGDTLGATQQITELVFYLGLVLWSFNS
jgi:adenosylcobinamide-GDP ribazoletransferase